MYVASLACSSLFARQRVKVQLDFVHGFEAERSGIGRRGTTMVTFAWFSFSFSRSLGANKKRGSNGVQEKAEISGFPGFQIQRFCFFGLRYTSQMAMQEGREWRIFCAHAAEKATFFGLSTQERDFSHESSQLGVKVYLFLELQDA